MSKKDYIRLAQALGYTRPDVQDSEGEHKQWLIDRGAIADACQEENGRFDRKRFYDATEGKWTAAQRRAA